MIWLIEWFNIVDSLWCWIKFISLISINSFLNVTKHGVEIGEIHSFTVFSFKLLLTRTYKIADSIAILQVKTNIEHDTKCTWMNSKQALVLLCHAAQISYISKSQQLLVSSTARHVHLYSYSGRSVPGDDDSHRITYVKSSALALRQTKAAISRTLPRAIVPMLMSGLLGAPRFPYVGCSCKIDSCLTRNLLTPSLQLINHNSEFITMNTYECKHRALEHLHTDLLYVFNPNLIKRNFNEIFVLYEFF